MSESTSDVNPLDALAEEFVGRSPGAASGRRWTSSSRAGPTWPTTSAISFRAWC